jgi:hypothetical protein
MKKRSLAAFLWFYAGWYAGALIADFLNISPLLGPVLGAALAAFIAGDPRHLIWKDKAEVATTADTEASAEPA